MGNAIHLNPDIEVVGIMAVGQNKWMFRSKTVGMTTTPGPRGMMMPALRLQMPDDVERCQRRQFLRVATAEVRLPEVECFPLLDPMSAIPAEIACRDAIQSNSPFSSAQTIMPEVGPKFTAKLVNIGGGGVGLLVPKSDTSGVNRSKFIWVRFDLRPEIASPLCVTARIAHTHLNHEQDVYAGVSFEFAFHANYRPFVADLLVRYVGVLQERQMANRKAA
jgi:c-di-GMP-binding flagellar brake protein YcgR